jgi:hypothetical protein
MTTKTPAQGPGVDDEHVLALVEAVDGAYRDAIGDLALDAPFIDDVGHSPFRSKGRAGILSLSSQIYLRIQEMRRPSCPREHAIADDAALDFTGTFEDCSQPCVAPIALDSTFGGVAVAAMELHGLICDTHRHFGG